MGNEYQNKIYKILEIMSVSGSIAAIVLKVMQFQFAAPILVVFVGTLATIYAVVGNELLKNKRTNTENNFVLLFSGVSLATGLIAIPFKLLYWPNATNILTIANISIPISISVCFWLKLKNEDAAVYNSVLIRSAVIYPIAVFLYLIPVSTLISFQDRGDPELIRLKIQHYDYPENETYLKQLNDYWFRKPLSDSIQ